tara:strand:- start:1060 stop:1950 length:891 start_codon:yes stop_codon:yes gene_type:complete
MVICVDRVRKKVDKFLDLVYKSNPKNQYVKSDTLDLSNKTPRVVRGITRIDLIKQFLDNNIDFYYIDTGYMGCYPKKNWHRFTKNNFQTLDHLNYKQLDFLTDINLLKERFRKIMFTEYDRYKPKRPVEGESILIIPPSAKVLRCLTVMKHTDFTQDHYIDWLTKEIRKYTDKRIIVRQKPNRDERTKGGQHLKHQLKRDKVHCLVAFNSIAAFEAIQEGYPAITLGPNAASFLSEKEIKNVHKPYFADDDKIREHSLYLSACQFNREEFRNGYAVKQIEQLQHDQTYNYFKFKCQ